MAYSTELEDLIDHTLIDDEELVKKKMFGGVSYFLNGNMCFGIHEESLIFRTTEENGSVLLKKEGFSPFDITGSKMTGWILVEPGICQHQAVLEHLLRESIRYAAALPKKEK